MLGMQITITGFIVAVIGLMLIAFIGKTMLRPLIAFPVMALVVAGALAVIVGALMSVWVH